MNIPFPPPPPKHALIQVKECVFLTKEIVCIAVEEETINVWLRGDSDSFEVNCDSSEEATKVGAEALKRWNAWLGNFWNEGRKDSGA